MAYIPAIQCHIQCSYWFSSILDTEDRPSLSPGIVQSHLAIPSSRHQYGLWTATRNIPHSVDPYWYPEIQHVWSHLVTIVSGDGIPDIKLMYSSTGVKQCEMYMYVLMQKSIANKKD